MISFAFTDAHSELTDLGSDVVQKLTDFAEQHLEILMGIGVVLFFLYIFLYAFVIVPRRNRRFFAQLKAKGYGPVKSDNKKLHEVINELAPIYDTMIFGPSMDEYFQLSQWKIDLAVGKEEMNRQSYIFSATRDIELKNLPETFDRHRTVGTFMALEAMSLPLKEELYIRAHPKPNTIKIAPELELKSVNSNLETAFLERFLVLSASGTVTYFPSEVQRVLIALLPRDQPKNRPSLDGLYPPHLKFTPFGWGICINKILQDKKAMNTFWETFEQISRALQESR